MVRFQPGAPINQAVTPPPRSGAPPIVLLLCYFLAAVDRAPPPRRANSPADDAHSAAPSRSFSTGPISGPYRHRPRLDEPGGKGVPKVMEPEPRDARLPHRRIERPQQIACIPWVARPIHGDRLRAAGPHRGAGLEHCHRRVIHRQRIPRAVLLFQNRERPSSQIHTPLREDAAE